MNRFAYDGAILVPMLYRTSVSNFVQDMGVRTNSENSIMVLAFADGIFFIECDSEGL